MKKSGKYLEFYREALETGRIPYNVRDGAGGGLCGIFGAEVMDIFRPTTEDCIDYDVRYWGYYAHDPGFMVSKGFGPTRQNIVLFLAAMNGEL